MNQISTNKKTMESWKKNITFLGYIVISVVAVVIKVNSLYDTSPNFYVLGSRLSTGDSLLILSNLLIMLALVIGKALQYLIFGELRLIEIEHLYERLWPSIIGFIISANAFQRKENAFNQILLCIGLLFSKVFHCITTDRLDALIQQYYQTNGKSLTHITLNRVTLLMFVFLRIDIYVIKSCIDESFVHRSTMLLVIAFEFFLLAMDLSYSVVKFGLNVFELYYVQRFPEEEVWPYKVWIDSITKVILGLITCIMIPTLFTFFTLLDTVPLNLLNELARALYRLSKSIQSLYRLINNVRKLNNALGYPTAEDLEDSDICIICRGDMILEGSGTARSVPRKLPCGHIFHDGCIRSWLEMSNACPICRKPVITSSTSSSTNTDENDNVNINANNEGNQMLPVEIPLPLDNEIGNNEQEENRNVNNFEADNENNEINTRNEAGNANDNENIVVDRNTNEVTDANTEETPTIPRTDQIFPEANENEEDTTEEQFFPLTIQNMEEFKYSAYSSDVKNRNRRLIQIEEAINKFGSLPMNSEQKAKYEVVKSHAKQIRTRFLDERYKECKSGRVRYLADDRVLNLPRESVIPKDWTLFPVVKDDDGGYEINLGVLNKVHMKVVKNERVISKETFDKYTRKFD